jgi:hypothetical protein
MLKPVSLVIRMAYSDIKFLISLRNLSLKFTHILMHVPCDYLLDIELNWKTCFHNVILMNWSVSLNTCLQLLPRSRKCGSIHWLPHTPSWHGASSLEHRNNFIKFVYRRIKESAKFIHTWLMYLSKKFSLRGSRSVSLMRHLSWKVNKDIPDVKVY